MSVPKHPLQSKKAARSPGFTLIELLVTIALVAVMVGIALPSFRDFTIRMGVTTNTNDLVGAINLARSEAVKRGTSVTLGSLSGDSVWSSGWSVKAGTEVIRAYPALASGYSVTTIAVGTGSDAKGLVFNSRGDLGQVTSFDFAVCRPDSKPAESRHIQVQGSGLVTTKQGAPGSTCT